VRGKHFCRQVRAPVYPICPPGQTATITAADPSGIVLQTFQSTGILISGLVFQGGSTGVLLNRGSNVTIVNCTMQRNSGDGLGMQMASTLVMENSTLQDNQGNGMSVAVGSNATMATNPNERIRVLRNGGDGIDVDGSFFQVNFGTLDVENNAGAAIAQFGGRLLIFGDGVGGGNLFQNNGEGIDVFEAGSARFFGRNVIRNNGDVGLQILGSSVAFTGGGTLPDGSLRATVIEGHATVGVNVFRLGELTMSGPHKIQNNGSVTGDPTLRGGIRMNRGSLTLNNGVQISNNVGPGIRADFNTGASFGSVTVTNNSEAGVRVGRQSVGGFVAPLTFAGNGEASISCDNTSLIFGDLTGVANIECNRIEKAPGSRQSGRVQQD
jgi:Right handed beta helix region